MIKQLVKAGCDAFFGRNNTHIETNLKDFNEVEVSGAWQVNVNQGKDWKVEFSSKKIGEQAQVDVLGHRLRLTKKRTWRNSFISFSSGGKEKVKIVMPELKALKLSGSTKIALSDFRGERLKVKVAGTTRLEGHNGNYKELNLSAAGASKIDLQNVVTTDAEVSLKGASKVILNMNGGVLSGSTAGAAVIQYYGSVFEQKVTTAGAAKISKLRKES